MTATRTWALVVICLVYGACAQKEKKEAEPGAPEGRVGEGTSGEAIAGGALAVVNGIPITTEEFLRQIEPYPARMKESIQGREHVLQTLIDQFLLEAEAKRLSLDKDPDYVRKVDNYRQNLLQNLLVDTINKEGFVVTEKETKEYFDAHPEEFDYPERVQVRHILLATEAETKEVLAKIKKGEPFERMVKEYSKDTATLDRDGDLGQFSRKQRPDLADAAFSLTKPSEISGPVQTQRGYHLLQLIRRVPAEKETFEQALQNLIARLRAQKRQEAIKGLVEKLRGEAQMKVSTQALEALQIPTEVQ